MLLNELLDRNVLGDAIADGWVKEQTHPTDPLAILNYTDKAQVASANEVWDHPYFGATVRQCRGLIYRTDTGQVVATPWPKFFNHGQGGADRFTLEEPVFVTDKVDGSLGIVYVSPTTGLTCVATRGSFTSDQAEHATGRLQNDSRFHGWRPPQGVTVLAEIVYPANRIVVDYGSTDELILLGAVDIVDGHIHAPNEAARAVRWPGPVARTFVYKTLGEALDVMDRENAEGYVIMSDLNDSPLNLRRMIKLKQEDYKALHAARFGLNQRSVYNALMVSISGPDEQYGDTTLDRLLEITPDEVHDWIRMQARQLKARVTTPAEQIRKEYGQIMDSHPWELYAPGTQRKHFAEMVKGDPYAWAYFLLYEGRGDQVELKLWKKLDTDGRITPASSPVGENCRAFFGTLRCPGCIYCPRSDEEV